MTDRGLRALKPTGTQYTIWDATLPNFGARVSLGGRVAFVIMRRAAGGKRPIRVTLGHYPAMTLEKGREAASAALGELVSGKDPRKERERRQDEQRRIEADTFASVAFEFIKRHASKRRTAGPIEQIIKRELVSRWGDRPVTAITRRDVIEMVEEIVDRGAPYAADQALVYCRRLFRWALDRDVYGLTGSPVTAISSKNHGVEKKPRTHILSDGDLRLLWAATDESSGPDYPLSPFVRLLLMLGQRRGEVADMRWGDVDEAKAQWTIPRTKADAPHVVPLPKLAVDLLDSLPRFTGPFVFTTTDGTRPIQGFAKLKDRLDARLKGVGTLAPFRLHDLRRSMRTHLSALPVPGGDLVRELVIGHTKPGLHKVYDQFAYLDEKREALELWTRRLQSIVAPPPASPKVVPLRGDVA